ncbi:13296_t:CDS:1, partial [Gigaspora rosea]
LLRLILKSINGIFPFGSISRYQWVFASLTEEYEVSLLVAERNDSLGVNSH